MKVGGEEAILNRPTGTGVVSGINLGSRTVVGLTTRVSRSDARDPPSRRISV
jgi:hypothetical protein